MLAGSASSSSALGHRTAHPHRVLGGLLEEEGHAGAVGGSAMRSVCIENPGANISVSTARPVPASAASASSGATRERGLRVLPRDVVLDSDLHRASAFNRAAASSITSGRLQAGEAHERQAGCGVVVEDSVRHRDHTAALGRRGRTQARRPRRAGGCRRSRSRCRRQQHRSRLWRGRPTGGRVSLLAMPPARGSARRSEAHRDGALERRRVHVGEELLHGAHCPDQRRRRAGPAEPSTRCTRTSSRPTRWRRCDRACRGATRYVLAVEHQVLVHLVGNREQVVLHAHVRDGVELGTGEDLARGVVRELSSTRRCWRHRGRELVDVEVVVGIRSCTARRCAPAIAMQRRES